LPPLLDRAATSDDLPHRAADLLHRVWTETVEPAWSRRLRVIEADIAARTDRLGRHGWAAALGDMRPAMRWLGADRLQVTTCDSPPRALAGAELMFVPVTPHQTWVCWDAPPTARYAVVHPCAGVLADDRPPVPDALAALLGRARATLLTLLGTPKTTTQLVALTGLPLGSVGRHLRILREARLVHRRRAGRSVLYFLTGPGRTLGAAQDGQPPGSPHDGRAGHSGP
ncbi:MAG: helix-turn-helix domain-containing protein, partial [Streptomyces sp.]|nr:helix-turn-helix domain-containing protein [Streptomyces sp.]